MSLFAGAHILRTLRYMEHDEHLSRTVGHNFLELVEDRLIKFPDVKWTSHNMCLRLRHLRNSAKGLQDQPIAQVY